MTTLRERLINLIASNSSEWTEKLPAFLGNISGQVETGTPGVHWARFTNGQEIRVLNRSIPGVFDTQVFVGRSKSQPKIWQVISAADTYVTPTAGVGPHANDHHLSGSDPVWVERKQVLTLSVLVSDSDSFLVQVYGGLVVTATGFAEIENQEVDLSSYVPTAGAKYVTIESDDDGLLTVNDTAAAFESKELGTIADIPTPATGQYPIAVILLYEQQAELLNDHIRLASLLSSVGLVENLDDLLDVDAPAPSDGQVLTYDSYTGLWYAATPTGGSGDVAGDIHAATEKVTIHDDDEIGGPDSEDSWSLVKWTFATVKAWVIDFADALYAAIGHTHSLDTEGIQDIVGGMVSGNTETGIAVSYNDTGGKLDFVVSPSSVGAIPDDGWMAVTETWTRTGNHTFTVSGDFTTRYSKGKKVKYNDGAVDYGVIGSSSHAGGTTTINLIPNNDYAMAATTISAKYVSYIENPEGFPDWFTYAPTWSAGGSMTFTSVTTAYARWRTSGKSVHVVARGTGTTGGTAHFSLIATLPIDAAQAAGIPAGTAYVNDGGNSTVGFCFISATGPSIVTGRKYDSSNFALAANRILAFDVNYEY